MFMQFLSSCVGSEFEIYLYIYIYLSLSLSLSIYIVMHIWFYDLVVVKRLIPRGSGNSAATLVDCAACTALGPPNYAAFFDGLSGDATCMHHL